MTEEIIARLKSLDLSEGSHSRLSASETLRDMLIETLEDADGNDYNNNSHGCDCAHHRCDQHGRQVSYDALGNERHKAVCALRNASFETGSAIKKLAHALGVKWNPDNAPKSMGLLRDRLIHLLGGNEPNLQESPLFEDSVAESVPEMTKSAEIAKPESEDGGENCRITDEKLNGESLIESLVKSTEELSRQGKVKFPPNEDGSIESLKTVEETAALIDEVERRAVQSHGSSPMRQENETRITDELREFATDPLLGYASQESHVERITAIADRIDEQFDRICEQQETVLQHTIDTMVEERDELAENRNMWRGKAMQLTDVVDRYVGRYEDVLELLRDATKEYANCDRVWGYFSEASKNTRLERKCNELFELLRDAAGDYKAVLFERDEWRHSAEHEADKRKEYKGLFERHRDSYVEYIGKYNTVVREREELRKSLRMIAERIGVPHHRSLSMYGDEALREATLDTIDSKNEHIDALEWQRDRQRKLLDEYERRDTPEDIVCDIHFGRVTDSEAVERIRALP